jgi:ABC-2 type transport system permease protein
LTARVSEALIIAYRIILAEIYLRLRQFKNNPPMLIVSLAWPYLMVIVVLVLGTSYGSLEEYARRLGVADPVVFLLAASGVAFTAVSIIDYGASFAVWHRWLGTLPYLALATPSLSLYLAASGAAVALLSVAVTYASIAPAIVALGGLESGLRLALIVAIVLAGMIPLAGLAALAAVLSVALKVESHVLSFINPLMLLVSGVFYPLELLPRLLKALSVLVPVSYVVEASKLVAALENPLGAKLYFALYAIAALSVLYNVAGLMLTGRVEKEVMVRGAAA